MHSCRRGYSILSSVLCKMKYKCSKGRFLYPFSPTATSTDINQYKVLLTHSYSLFFFFFKGAGPSCAWEAIGEVHSLVCGLKASAQECRIRQDLKDVAKRIEKKAGLLDGYNRRLAAAVMF